MVSVWSDKMSILLIFIFSFTDGKKLCYLIINFYNYSSSFPAEDCYTPKWVPGFCTNLRRCESMLQVIQQYNQNGDSSAVTYLQNSICGYDGFDMMVCCPSLRFMTTTVAPLYFFSFGTSSFTGATFAPIVNSATPAPPLVNNNNPQTFAPINFTPGPPLPPIIVDTQTLPAAVFPTAAPPSSGSTLPTFERNQCGMSNATHSRVVGGLPAQVNAWPWIALVGYRTAFDANPRFLCGGTLITQRHVVTAAHCIKESLWVAVALESG